MHMQDIPSSQKNQTSNQKGSSDMKSSPDKTTDSQTETKSSYIGETQQGPEHNPPECTYCYEPATTLTRHNLDPVCEAHK